MRHGQWPTVSTRHGGRSRASGDSGDGDGHLVSCQHWVKHQNQKTKHWGLDETETTDEYALPRQNQSG